MKSKNSLALDTVILNQNHGANHVEAVAQEVNHLEFTMLRIFGCLMEWTNITCLVIPNKN